MLGKSFILSHFIDEETETKRFGDLTQGHVTNKWSSQNLNSGCFLIQYSLSN